MSNSKNILLLLLFYKKILVYTMTKELLFIGNIRKAFNDFIYLCEQIGHCEVL